MTIFNCKIYYKVIIVCNSSFFGYYSGCKPIYGTGGIVPLSTILRNWFLLSVIIRLIFLDYKMKLQIHHWLAQRTILSNYIASLSSFQEVQKLDCLGLLMLGTRRHKPLQCQQWQILACKSWNSLQKFPHRLSREPQWSKLL